MLWILLPLELWTLIATRLRVRDMAAVRAVFLRHLSPDALFREVALHRWGRRFWERARARLTRAVFRSYEDELRRLERFEDCLSLMQLPPWTAREYELWWECEEQFLLSKSSTTVPAT